MAIEIIYRRSSDRTFLSSSDRRRELDPEQAAAEDAHIAAQRSVPASPYRPAATPRGNSRRWHRDTGRRPHVNTYTR